MKKLLVKENQITLISTLTTEQLVKALQLQGGAIKIVETDEDGNRTERFAVTTGTKGQISGYGIVFNGTTTGEGKFAKTTITMDFTGCKTSEDKKRKIAEKIGSALVDLAVVEEEIVAELAKYEEALKATMELVNIKEGTDEE